MRHVGVRRLATLLGFAFFLWGGVFAWLAGREPVERSPQPVRVSVPPGAALFERHCASCHDLDAMRSAAGNKQDAARQADLARFLEDHGGASSEENRQILDFLTGP